MCQLHAVQEKPSPWLRGSHHPILCRSDLQVLVFEESMCHIASPTHCLSPVADHSTRLISPRHRKPPCCHPSTTHPVGRGALSHGLEWARRSAWPRASGHPQLRAEFGDSSGGERLRSRGEGFSFELWRWGGSAWRGC